MPVEPHLLPELDRLKPIDAPPWLASVLAIRVVRWLYRDQTLQLSHALRLLACPAYNHGYFQRLHDVVNLRKFVLGSVDAKAEEHWRLLDSVFEAIRSAPDASLEDVVYAGRLAGDPDFRKAELTIETMSE